MKCSICKKDYDGWGNNAEPVNSGRCCDGCNWTQVIPARLMNFAKPKVKVGDRIEFQIGEEIYTDRITYVMGHIIEGEKFCLTYTNFKIANS